MFKIFIAHDFNPESRKKRFRGVVDSIGRANGFEVVYGEVPALESLLPKNEFGRDRDFFMLLRDALSECDYWVVDITKYEKSEDETEKVIGINLNVLLELGLIYGINKKRVDVFCHQDAKAILREELSNLSGRTALFKYYGDLEDFRGQLSSLLPRVNDVLSGDKGLADKSMAPRRYYEDRQFGFRFSYPGQWHIQSRTPDIIEICGDGLENVKFGVEFAKAARRTIFVDNAQFNEKQEEIERDNTAWFHSAESKNGGSEIVYHKLDSKFPDIDKLIQIDSKRIFDKEPIQVDGQYMFRTILPNFNIYSFAVVTMIGDRGDLLKLRNIINEILDTFSEFLPFEMKSIDIQIDRKNYRIEYGIAENYSDPGEYFEIRIYEGQNLASTIPNLSGVKVPARFRKYNVVESEHLLLTKIADKLFHLILFNYGYGSSPGEIVIIEISEVGIKTVFRSNFEIRDILFGKGIEDFRISGSHSYSETVSMKPHIYTYDPISVYSYRMGNLALNEMESIITNEEIFSEFKGFNPSTDIFVMETAGKGKILDKDELSRVLSVPPDGNHLA